MCLQNYMSSCIETIITLLLQKKLRILVHHGQTRQPQCIIYLILFFHILVACFVMHDQLVTDKVKAVALCLVRICNHFLYDVLVDGREVVYGIPAVGAPRNAKAEAEIIALDKLVLEVVALNHPKVGDRLLADIESEAATSIL
jgi:hypothetical protein